MKAPPQGQGRPLIFGEVLFDTFPDGARVLGGAPFNVAWHLQGFGEAPLFVSAVGADRQGEEVLDSMRAWGLDTRGVQVHEAHSTGKVAVTLRDGQPSYDIVSHQAYDYIALSGVEEAIRGVRVSLIYHGSLAVRHDTSRQTLAHLRAQLAIPRCVDVNLRAPWWRRESVLDDVAGADCVKLNDGELMELAAPGMGAEDDLLAAATALLEQSGMQVLIVTRGEQGAVVLTADETLWGDPVTVDEVVDTVGAGDAFSAVVLLGMQRGWEWPDILQRALAFAARICRVRGATLGDRGLYTAFLEAWTEDGRG